MFFESVNLFWPVRCAACNARMPPCDGGGADEPFCALCRETLLPVKEPYCPRCGLAFEGVGPSHLCGECLADPPPFSGARAVFEYGAAAKEAALRLKYGRVAWLGNALGRSMRPIAASMTRPDFVVPVPLHEARLRERGFNQSALLAAPSAVYLRSPLLTGVLRRIRNTTPQAGLSRADRMDNIRGAFCISGENKVSGKRVMLVDDVITTGMTVREAAAVLLHAGAVAVEVIAFARAC